MTGVSTLGQALAQIERFKNIQGTYSDLSTQLATGKKTQKFSGLGPDILSTQRARADLKSINTYINNITNTERRITASLTALREFKAQAENFAEALTTFTQQGTHQKGDVVLQDDPASDNDSIAIGRTSADIDTDFKNLQSLATNISDFMLDLVNSKDGDRYLFAGADTRTKPIENMDNLNAAISASLTNWKNEGSPSHITTDALISGLRESDNSVDPNAITDTMVGYSASISAGTAGDIFARISDNTELEYTTMANEGGFRDIMVAISVISNENFAPIMDVYQEPYTYGDNPVVNGAPGDTIEEQQDNFFAVYNDLSTMTVDAIDKIDEQIFALESVRARMLQTQENYQADKNLLSDIISENEDADINQVAVQLNSLSVTLDASFRVVSRLQDLSLVNFI